MVCDLCPGRMWWQAQLQPLARDALRCSRPRCDKAPNLDEGLQRLNRYREDPVPFHVTVSMLSGRTRSILGLHARDRFARLLVKIGQEFNIPPAEVQVSLGNRLLAAGEQDLRLQSLGIQKGLMLTCVRQQQLEEALAGPTESVGAAEPALGTV